MNIYQINPDITLVDLAIPIIGAEGMLGSYVIKASRIAVMDVGPSNSLDTPGAAWIRKKLTTPGNPSSSCASSRRMKVN